MLVSKVGGSVVGLGFAQADMSRCASRPRVNNFVPKRRANVPAALSRTFSSSFFVRIWTDPATLLIRKKNKTDISRNPSSIHVGCHVTNRRTFRAGGPAPPRRSRHTTARPSTARRRRIAAYSAAMTEVQRATHPRGTAASPPRVLTRKASAGDDRHPRDDERDPSSRVTDGRASPAPPGVRRSRRDLADSAEDLASGAAGSPVKRTREGAPPDNTGPTPASVRAGSCAATEEEGKNNHGCRVSRTGQSRVIPFRAPRKYNNDRCCSRATQEFRFSKQNSKQASKQTSAIN